MSSKRFVEWIPVLRLTGFNRADLNLAIVALVVSVSIALGIVTSVAVGIERAYLENHCFFFDPAAYYERSIEAFRAFKEMGCRPALVRELCSNERCPARTIPYLLFMPSALVDLWGHLWTEIPVIFSFLTLLAWTVYNRTSSVCLAISSVAMFCSFPFLYEPVNGIAAYWLDTAAAYALGSAVICLLNYCRTKHQSWLFYFGLFASLTALCRWSAIFYFLSFAALSVPAAIGITKDTLNRDAWKHALSLVSLLPLVIFGVCFFDQNVTYYKTYGYAFNASILKSVAWNLEKVPSLLGVVNVAFLVALAIINLLQALHAKIDRLYCFIALWFPISIFLFLCITVKAIIGIHPLVYYGPAFLVAGLCTTSRNSRHWIWWQVVFAVVAVTGFSLVLGNISTFWQSAIRVSPREKLEKQRDRALADLISEHNARTLAEFDSETLGPELEAVFKGGNFCRHIPNTFSIHESYFKGFFGKDTPPEEMAGLSYSQAKGADLVVVFSKPADALNPGVFNNRYSSTVSKLVSELVAKDPNFSLVSTLEGPAGNLSVYRNSSAVKPR